MSSHGRYNEDSLVIAFFVGGLLLRLCDDEMMSGTILSVGMMGSGSMGGISWMWLPILLVFALGVLLFSVFSGKE